MATGMSEYLAQKWLDALCNNTSFAVTTAYVKLHTGDPGAAGTSNAATETDRQSASFSVAPAASGGFVTIENDSPVSWSGISGSQDATHFSLWDDATAGNFLGSGVITANAYTDGDTYTAGAGAFTLSLPVAT